MVQREVERRAVHAILLLVTVAKVMASHILDDGAIVMLVWNGLALLRIGRAAHIPMAIVRRYRGSRPWRAMFPRRQRLRPTPPPEPEPWDVGQWRPLEPYVLESRPWT